MDLQPCRALLFLTAVALASGCHSQPPPLPPAYSLVAAGSAESHVRLFRSANYLLYTTLLDDARIEPIIATLEAARAACIDVTGFHPAVDALPENVFVFEHRSEWEAFTRSRAGAEAATYLQIDRGGYTLGKACVVRDQGERDTLRVLAHESMHLFIATHFAARPPPFVEEGLATLMEDVELRDGIAKIAIGRSVVRAARLAALEQSGDLLPLRDLLAMHAGNVVGLGAADIEGFYAQAWAFVRFLRESENGRYRPVLSQLLNDAATGALSSKALAANPALVERYLGESLTDLEPRYKAFVARVSNR